MTPSRIVISSESEKSFSFAVRGSCEESGNGKHRTPCDLEVRCFMQKALRRKTETGNEKDPSAALGMTKRGKAYLTFFFNLWREPTSAPSGASFHGKEGDGGFRIAKPPSRIVF